MMMTAKKSTSDSNNNEDVFHKLAQIDFTPPCQKDTTY